MQNTNPSLPPAGVVFDSDMGNTIDDALALAMLHALSESQEPEIRLVAVSVSKPNLQAAVFCDAVGGFYSEYAQVNFPPQYRRRRALPVALADHGPAPRDTPLLTATLSLRNAKGELRYPAQIGRLTDTAEVGALIRNALTAQHDQNGVVVLTGPATNLVRVLDVRGAREIIERKVRLLCVAAGSFPSGAPDPHIEADVSAARRLLAEWPSPIVAAGREIGEAVLYPAASIERDFAWASHHPIVDAYRAAGPMPYDAPTWALAPVLYSARSGHGYFQLSEPGTIVVNEDGRTGFTPSAGGRHRYLVLDASARERVLQAYIELVSAQPAPREIPDFIKRQIEEDAKRQKEQTR